MRFRVLKANCILNNCVIAYVYRILCILVLHMFSVHAKEFHRKIRSFPHSAVLSPEVGNQVPAVGAL